MNIKELAERLAIWAESVRIKPLSESWMYDAIRHYDRNVEWYSPEDGAALGRWDGAEIAQVVNLLPQVVAALNAVAVARAALEKLARLGNGEHYGNSDGNMIAHAALAELEKTL